MPSAKAPSLNSIIESLRERYPEAHADLLREVFRFAEAAASSPGAPGHGGDTRHLLEIASILVDLNMDESTVIAGLLHDSLGRPGADPAELRRVFGVEVSEVVASLAKILTVRYSAGARSHAENFRRLILSMARDVRVVIIKLAHQLYTMRGLEAAPREEQVALAAETLDIYAPLANRLGIHRLKSDLEDLGLRYSEPAVFEDIQAKVGGTSAESAIYIEEVKGLLTRLLDQQGIPGEVIGRTKHIFSIYRKMIAQNIPFEKVYDRIAFRIIVGEVRDCYAVLGAVHARWTPVPGRFKDYIALPKSNLYQSLHTTVIGPRGQPMEVQIRTREMHRIAEDGIAAHWRYKEKLGESKEDRIFGWLRQLVESSREVGDDREFLEKVKGDLFPEVVYVFTPAGEVVELPQGSTPVDFAFEVHSQVGMKCVGARVNDRMVPLNHVLKNGDRVEIITSKTQNPSADWLEFVKSSKARSKIRQWIRNEQRQRSVALGRELCEREFRKVGRSLAKATKEGLVDEVAERLGLNKTEELLEAVGYGKTAARLVLEKVYPEYENREPEEPKRPRKVKKGGKGIVIRGVGDTMVRFAKCCNPLPMEPVVGFITRGMGLTVHTADCPNLARTDPSRRIDVEWGTGGDEDHPVRIRVICEDKKGMLATITNTLSQHDVNVAWAEVKTFVVGRAECSFEILVPSLEGLNKILKEIQAIKGVYNVIRVKT